VSRSTLLPLPLVEAPPRASGDRPSLESDQLPPAPTAPARSLVIASLEIGKALADRGRATFRAQGTCMYPCVRPGDVLHIASRTVEEVAVGDIAVCRGSGFLFAHRTIRTGVEDGRQFIATRPDRSRHGEDSPTYDQDVLGVVTGIERRGRRLSPLPQRYGWPRRAGLATRLVLLEGWSSARARPVDALAHVQGGALYRRITRLWLRASGANVSFEVRLPLRADQVHDLYHSLSPDELDPTTMKWLGRPLDCWTLALKAYGNRQPAATATFVLQGPDNEPARWSLQELQVRARFRGAGLEADLLQKAEEILARGGAALCGHG